MSLSKVIDTARAELGYTESPPGSNRTKYGQAFAWDGVPWCVIFLWWCFREAGEREAFYGGKKTASCGTLLKWYREHGQIVPVSEIQPGDIVLLNFNGSKDAEHCGLVVEVPESKRLFKTIEGNTSYGIEGSQDNGGCVTERWRYLSQIVGVCRPEYTEEVEPVDDIKGRWSEASIRRCIKLGIVKGYPDGSFKPEKPITREEVCVIMDRVLDLQIGKDDGR